MAEHEPIVSRGAPLPDTIQSVQDQVVIAYHLLDHFMKEYRLLCVRYSMTPQDQRVIKRRALRYIQGQKMITVH